MEPLDLTTTRPRTTRAELSGIVFLPRSIDKLRASLPGGNLNGYSIEGFTGRMLEHLGISAEALRGVGAEAWNTYVLNRELYLGNRAEAIAENPWLAEHPEITLSLDFLQYMEDHGL